LNTNQEILKSLKNIEKKLDVMIKIQKSMAPEPKITPEEKTILKFCNSKYTINDIVEKTKKSKNNVKVVLSYLRSKGIIKSVTIKGKIVYSKV
jgi:hypothetical protein